MRTIKKKGGGKLGRSEIVQVRFEPQMRFGAELAARAEKRTLSSYIESTVFKHIQTIDVYFLVEDSFLASRTSTNPLMLAELVKKLWDADEVQRFLNLAEHAPLLLSPEERLRWSFINKERSFWRNSSTPTKPRRPFTKFLKVMWSHLVDMSDAAEYDWDLHNKTLLSLTPRAPEPTRTAYTNALKDLRACYDED